MIDIEHLEAKIEALYLARARLTAELEAAHAALYLARAMHDDQTAAIDTREAFRPGSPHFGSNVSPTANVIHHRSKP